LQNPPSQGKCSPEIQALKLPPVRAIFRAPEGYAMGSTDYSAAHARICCETTGDEAFRKSYIENLDIHCKVASEIAKMIGKDWSEEFIGKVRKEKSEDGRLATSLRNVSKNVFYGWINGAGANTTENTITTGGFNCQKGFGKHILNVLGEAFPRVKAFQDSTKAHIRKELVEFEGSKIKYTWVRGLSGRRVYLPVWPPSNTNKYGGARPNDALYGVLDDG
jgi:DNA polymerase I - 3''-5'' exonuclease and polymerase domains